MSTTSSSDQGKVLVLDEPDVIRKKFKTAVTDSGREIRYVPDEKPGVSNLIEILSVSTGRSIEDLERDYDGRGYGDLKGDVGEAVVELFAPMQEAFYAATSDAPTTLNGIAVTANPGSSLEGIKAAGPKPMLERLAKHAPGIVMEPKVFSLALRLSRVAAGTLDLAFASTNSHDWDLAAADLLVHQAGGALTTFAGQTLIYNRADPVHGALVAAGRSRHEAFLALVRAKTLAFA
jgi:hypothetical protein